MFVIELVRLQYSFLDSLITIATNNTKATPSEGCVDT